MSDYEKAEKTEAERQSRIAEENAKLRRQKEEFDARQREAEYKEKKEIAAWAAQFDGETPRHREIRTVLYELATQHGPDVEQKQRELREEYNTLHYQYPNVVPTFTKVVYYECEQMGLKILKQGKNWVVRGLSEHDLDRFKETPKVILDTITKMPIGYTYLIRNSALYDFKKSGQYADLKIKIVDPDKKDSQ